MKDAHLGAALEQLNKKKYQKAISILEKGKQWPENIGVGKPYSPDERALDFYMAVMHKELGNIEQSNKLLNNVIAYTEQHLNTNSANHIYGLLATQKTGKNTDKLLKKLSAASKKSIKTQLALAIFQNDSDTLETLITKIKPANDVLNTLQQAKSL